MIKKIIKTTIEVVEAELRRTSVLSLSLFLTFIFAGYRTAVFGDLEVFRVLVLTLNYNFLGILALFLFIKITKKLWTLL